MHKAVKVIIAFVALALIALGMVFIIASYGLDQTFMTGMIMVLIAVGLLVFLYMDSRIQASKPTLVSQNIQMGGSGEFKQRKMSCKSCSAPIGDKDLKMIEGGIMYTCPYCGSVGAIEEEPKW